MNTPNDGGPAFPMPSGQEPRVDLITHYNEGMSLRDYFAAQALIALVSKAPLRDTLGEHGEKWTPEVMTRFRADMAISAYDYADAMLRAKGGVRAAEQAKASALVEICERWVGQSDGIMHKGCPVGQLVQDTKSALAAVKGGCGDPPDFIDALRQWKAAEETNDAAELENARKSRDAALARIGGVA